jgi:hypothetical protein
VSRRQAASESPNWAWGRKQRAACAPSVGGEAVLVGLSACVSGVQRFQRDFIGFLSCDQPLLEQPRCYFGALSLAVPVPLGRGLGYLASLHPSDASRRGSKGSLLAVAAISSSRSLGVVIHLLMSPILRVHLSSTPYLLPLTLH